MGIIVHKETERNTELNDRIAADLRARAQANQLEDPDLVEDTDYTKDMKKTSRFGWVWFVLAATVFVCAAGLAAVFGLVEDFLVVVFLDLVFAILPPINFIISSL